jgi:KaiC/GvpD/RAD55 family RecA-like ATPase
MIDLQAIVGARNGDDRRHVTYRYGEKSHPDLIGIHAAAWQRKQSVEEALRALGLPIDATTVATLESELARLIGEKEKAEGEQDRIGEVIYRTLDTVTPRKLSWLWPGRIPLGKYTEVIGYPGVGKSVMLIDLMARVSRGGPCPDSQEPMGPGDVVLLTAEDDAADTVRPRLDAAKADVSRVYHLDAIRWYDSDAKQKTVRSISLDRDVPAIEEVLTKCRDPKLVVIDPITAYCGDIDSHKAAEVRALLMPITSMAAQHGVAIVGITHFNKGTNGPAVGRGMGSLAWVAAARMAWGVVKDTADPSTRLVLPIKCNLAADASGLSYKIVDMDGVPVVAWSNTAVTTSIDDVLAAASGKNKATPKRQNAQVWLADLLANGRMPAAEVWHEADKAGMGERLVHWAKSQLGVTPYIEGFGRDGIWYWELPKGGTF